MDRALRVSVAAPTDAPVSDAPDAARRLPLGVVSAQSNNSPHHLKALKKSVSERAKSWADVVVHRGFRSGGSDITTWGSRSSLVEAAAQLAAGDGPPPLPTPPLPKRTLRRVPSWAAPTPVAPDAAAPDAAAPDAAASDAAASAPEPAAPTPELPDPAAPALCDSPAASPAVEIEDEDEIEAATPLPAVTPAAVRGEVWSTATSTNAFTHRSTAHGTASATPLHQRAPG